MPDTDPPRRDRPAPAAAAQSQAQRSPLGYGPSRSSPAACRHSFPTGTS